MINNNNNNNERQISITMETIFKDDSVFTVLSLLYTSYL